jgi:hypothetical protein
MTKTREEYLALADRVYTRGKTYVPEHLADAIRDLIAELDALTQDRDEWKDSCIAANGNQRSSDNKLFKLQEQFDALKAQSVDAARYRWLRGQTANPNSTWSICDIEGTAEYESGWVSDADAAIDAAMSAQQGESK